MKTRLYKTEGAVGERLFEEQGECESCGEWVRLDEMNESEVTGECYCEHCWEKIPNSTKYFIDLELNR